MCGIAGYFGSGEQINREVASEILTSMSATLVSRGPDDSGVWHDDLEVGLAHRRLSILDLSPSGHQPMASISGRYVIVFNGEIYNHLELRAELRNTNWQGHSDTETLLAAFEEWGIGQTLKKSIGMFAIALWDREERQLTLARDRLGEKPLYYGWQGNGERGSFFLVQN